MSEPISDEKLDSFRGRVNKPMDYETREQVIARIDTLTAALAEAQASFRTVRRWNMSANDHNGVIDLALAKIDQALGVPHE